MRTAPVLLSSVLFLCPGLWAQKGEAEQGYDPPGYAMTTWTGEVTATNDATREITLTYHKGRKTESFVGVLDEGYRYAVKGGGTHELKVSEIPLGTRVTTYYMEKEKKLTKRK